MEKLSLTIENELSVLEKYHLTAEEWLVVRLLFLASAEEDHKEYLARYLSTSDRQDLREVMLSLQNKGVILKSYKISDRGQSFDPADVEFNKIFLNNYFKYSAELGNDLFNNYPVSMIINGVTHMLRTPGRKFKDLDDLKFGYGKAIKHNPETHKKIMSLLDWAKERNLINMGMAEFVSAQAWLSLEAMQNGDGEVINMDAIKSL